jgi:hypothetical protein
MCNELSVVVVVMMVIVMMVPSVMVIRSRVCDSRNCESRNQDGGEGSFQRCFHCPNSRKKKRVWITERESLTPLKTDRTIFRTRARTLQCGAPW